MTDRGIYLSFGVTLVVGLVVVIYLSFDSATLTENENNSDLELASLQDTGKETLKPETESISTTDSTDKFAAKDQPVSAFEYRSTPVNGPFQTPIVTKVDTHSVIPSVDPATQIADSVWASFQKWQVQYSKEKIKSFGSHCEQIRTWQSKLDGTKLNSARRANSELVINRLNEDALKHYWHLSNNQSSSFEKRINVLKVVASHHQCLTQKDIDNIDEKINTLKIQAIPDSVVINSDDTFEKICNRYKQFGLKIETVFDLNRERRHGKRPFKVNFKANDLNYSDKYNTLKEKKTLYLKAF